MRIVVLLTVTIMLAALPAAGMAGRVDRAPAVGTLAPDFALPLLHSDPEKIIRLADLRGKPVALIFGSYT